MSKVTIELDTKQIESIVENLTIEQKLRLVRKLEKETLSQRWNNLLKTIDERRKKYPISQKEINKEIEFARKEFYAKRRS